MRPTLRRRAESLAALLYVSIAILLIWSQHPPSHDDDASTSRRYARRDDGHDAVVSAANSACTIVPRATSHPAIGVDQSDDGRYRLEGRDRTNVVDRYRPRTRRSCRDVPKDEVPTHYFIKAERHHGSNLMWLLLQYNAPHFERSRKEDGLHWKHGFLNPGAYDGVSYPRLFADVGNDGDGGRNGNGGGGGRNRTAMLVITRDVFHWLPRMHSMTYGKMDADGWPKRPLSEFIRAPYQEWCRAFNPSHAEFKRTCREPFEAAANVVQMRTLKYKNWMYVDPHWFGSGGGGGGGGGSNSTTTYYFYSRRSVMRYESILDEGQETTLRRFLDEHCVPMAGPSFRPVLGRTTWKGESKKKGRTFVAETDEEVLSKYTEEDIRFVLSQLDWDFESRVLNYSYGYVEQYLRRREEMNATAGSVRE